MRFENNIYDKRIIQAVRDAEALLDSNSQMLNYVKQKNDWRYGIKSGEDAATKLVSPDSPAPVLIYYPKYKNSDQTAAWNGERIGINGFWLPTVTHHPLLVGALIHEYCHKKGFHHQDKGIWGYVKRNYWSEEKSKYSLPYHLSDNIEKWL